MTWMSVVVAGVCQQTPDKAESRSRILPAVIDVVSALPAHLYAARFALWLTAYAEQARTACRALAVDLSVLVMRQMHAAPSECPEFALIRTHQHHR
jgi:hypothetical protein